MAVKASAAITLSAVVDVSAVTRYYLLQSSTLAKPAKPTAKPPSGGWTDAEPTYTSGSTNSLYFTDLTVFSDGTWSYSSVSLSSAYEAAKEAYNRANAAQSTAASAQSEASSAHTAANNAQSTADGALNAADVNARAISLINDSVGSVQTRLSVFSDGINTTIASHNEILSCMEYSEEGLRIRKGSSIYSTLTDEEGYHVCQNDQEIASFAEGGAQMNRLRIGNIMARKTSRGGWVWTEV